MSVPAHAPYDYQALKDLKRDISQQQEFGLLDIDDVNPITIIQTNGKPEPNNNSSSLHLQKTHIQRCRQRRRLLRNSIQKSV